MISSLLKFIKYVFVDDLPEGGYKPEYFGLHFPEVRRIYLKSCPQNHVLGNSVYAHTHKVLGDVMYNCICFAEETPIFDIYGFGGISYTMWHEYAHVLDKGYRMKDIKDLNFEQVQKLGHGKNWEAILEKLVRQNPVKL